MRQVLEDQELAQNKARLGQNTIQEHFSPTSLQAKMLARLKDIPMNKLISPIPFADEAQAAQYKHELGFHARMDLLEVKQAYWAWNRVLMSAEAPPSYIPRWKPLFFVYRLLARVRILGKLWAEQSAYYEALESHLTLLQTTTYRLQNEVLFLQHELQQLKTQTQERKTHE